MRFPIALVALASFLLRAAEPVGVLPGDPLARIGVRPADAARGRLDQVRFVGKDLYLNHCAGVVTHAIDDASPYVPEALDILDKYGIKATVFVSTGEPAMSELWPRLRRAIADGHEIGSHARIHRCELPESPAFCARAYRDSEVAGSRDDIRRETGQPYVWAWAYPCGRCAALPFVRESLARAGYLVARNYPGSTRGGELTPDLQAWDADPYDAAYTQVAQRAGEAAPGGRTDLAALDAKFDEVYQNGGIYSLVSNPRWVDLSVDGYYQRHLAHIADRSDIWYVPMGPLYGYQTVRERTEVRRLNRGTRWARFAVYNDLDPKVYNMSVTLEFEAPPMVRVYARHKQLPERNSGLTDRWTAQYVRRAQGKLYVTVQPNVVLEFR